MGLMSMGGRSVWWKTNPGAGALVLAADPGLVAGGALTATAVEAGVPTAVPDHGLSLAASTGLTPGQDGNHTQGQRGSPVTLNLQRSLTHTLTNCTVPLRAKSPTLAQTLASHAPRADPKSRRNANPKVVPRRNPTVRSLEAARIPTQRVET